MSTPRYSTGRSADLGGLQVESLGGQFGAPILVPSGAPAPIAGVTQPFNVFEDCTVEIKYSIVWTTSGGPTPSIDVSSGIRVNGTDYILSKTVTSAGVPTYTFLNHSGVISVFLAAGSYDAELLAGRTGGMNSIERTAPICVSISVVRV